MATSRASAAHGERHVPASHPVLQRVPAMATEPSRPEISNFNDRLDYVAMIVAQLPDRPLTVGQRERMRIIARELLRRIGHVGG